MASRGYRNVWNPNVFLEVDVRKKGMRGNVGDDGKEEKDGKDEKGVERIAFNTNFSNLKNLHQSLQGALKMHNSSKFNIARYSSV